MVQTNTRAILKANLFRACKIDNYIYGATAVPDLDFASAMSALLMKPSAVRSSRKFALSNIGGIHDAIAAGVADEHVE